MQLDRPRRSGAPSRWTTLALVASLILPASAPAEGRWQEFRRRSGNFFGAVWDEVTMVPSTVYNLPSAYWETARSGQQIDSLSRTSQAVADTAVEEAQFLPQWAPNLPGEYIRTAQSGEQASSFAGFVQGGSDRLTFGGARIDMVPLANTPEHLRAFDGGVQVGNAWADETAMTLFTAGAHRAGSLSVRAGQRMLPRGASLTWSEGTSPGPCRRWRQRPDVPDGYLSRRQPVPERQITLDRQGRPTDGTYTSHVAKNNQHMGIGDNVHGSQFDPNLADINEDMLRLSRYADENNLWFQPNGSTHASQALVPVRNGGSTQWVALRRQQRSGLVHGFPSSRAPNARDLQAMGLDGWTRPTLLTPGQAGAIGASGGPAMQWSGYVEDNGQGDGAGHWSDGFVPVSGGGSFGGGSSAFDGLPAFSEGSSDGGF